LTETDFDPYADYLPDTTDLSSRAISAVWFALGAMACGAAGPFLCYMPYVVAIPLGAIGAWKGWGVMQEAGTDEVGRMHRSTATAGFVGGLLAAVGGGLLVLMFGLIFALYGAMIVAAIGAGAAAG
jgi:hypothetical protein